MRAIRWSDNDRYFGPITWASDCHKRFAISVRSGGHGDADDGSPYLRISFWRWTLCVLLPMMIPPKRTKIMVPAWNNDGTAARLGRDWYWRVEPREYGISYWDGFLMVNYGIQPGDSSLDQSWCKHLPWTQWRHVRRSLYDLEGRHVWSELDSETSLLRQNGKNWLERFNIVQEAEKACPKMMFTFEDFDSEKLVATTHIEEREWRFGTGWFKWLSFFRRPRIVRSLSIAFSGETGRRKGSWKGGTVGHSIEMRHDDTHLSAFIRYCGEHDMKWTGWAAERAPYA